ncbi:MAG TPA: NAD(P)/FAD-dependent oxidoreductase [Candidatus Limnocylindrales bacterium]|nr:NAD(P)/FAD-dependent oxidoreductase [Candidatus Limnocylindrales bacterium]
MNPRIEHDAIIVGGGPNGLTAAVALTQAGRSVSVVEAEGTVGGGCRTAESTLPGFLHDVCSAVHPLARASPVLRRMPLERHGLAWIDPPIAFAHPLDDADTAFAHPDLQTTARALGPDEAAYRALMGGVVNIWDLLMNELVGPFRIPRHPLKAVRAALFGLHALQPAIWLARRFETPQARALLAGCAAHSMLRLSEPMSGAFGLTLLASAHAVGWPIAKGGSQRITDALAGYLEELGGAIVTGQRVTSLDELPASRAVMLDLTPRVVAAIAGRRLGRRRLGRSYLRQLRRYRYGPGVFKLDLALDGPIPWRDERILQAGTVHLGGTLEEIAESEATIRAGGHSERPFVLLAQPSLFDPGRAPAGRHTAWAYCHVPNGSTVDMSEAILRQVERFAPGLRERILAVGSRSPADIERDNANLVGGDINGGLQELAQFWTRPAVRRDPYTTPDPSLYVCSAATPPGGGVHGLCGWYAARSALRGALRA